MTSAMAVTMLPGRAGIFWDSGPSARHDNRQSHFPSPRWLYSLTGILVGLGWMAMFLLGIQFRSGTEAEPKATQRFRPSEAGDWDEGAEFPSRPTLEALEIN